MKRIQLFEFEDFRWFPDFIRSPMTRLLAVLNDKMGMDEAVAILIKRVLKETTATQIFDLCSGSGGVMPSVKDKLSQGEDPINVTLLLSDLHPSEVGIKKYNRDQTNGVHYIPKSVDARYLDSAPDCLRTMINSFHHMPTDIARDILASAQNNKEPTMIFEMQENKIPTLIWAIFLPLGLLITFIMALVLTPFSRPLTFSQLIFTYLIPIIPLCFAWDGQASYARMYSMKDIDELLPPATDDYRWEKGIGEKKNGKKVGTYLIGLPKLN